MSKSASVPPATLDAIGSALLPDAGVELTVAVAVEVDPSRRNDRGWPPWFVAVRLEQRHADPVIGLWAIGDVETAAGPLWAINSVAREFTDWGAAARGGSPADAMRTRLAGYPEAEEAVALLDN